MVGLFSVAFMILRVPKIFRFPSKVWPTIGLGPPRNSYRPKPPSSNFSTKKKQVSSRKISLPWMDGCSSAAVTVVIVVAVTVTAIV